MYKILSFAFLVILNLSFAINKQDNVLNQRLIGEGQIIKGMQPWNVKNGLLMCVYSSRADDSVGTSSALSFYIENSIDHEKIFQYPIDYHMVGIYQTCEYNGNLIVIWIAGSGYHFTVFSYLEGSVRLVLKGGSKIMPELVLTNVDSEYVILITHKIWVEDQKTGEETYIPTMTTVYKWFGDHYDRIDVPYKKRFNAEFKK
ncbi:MAG: hypothetical protein WAV76_01965 [Bacteroidota bacterium]